MNNLLDKKYDPKNVEDRLYNFWSDNGYFTPEIDKSKKPFSIVIPPPNVTGQLHMGHALDQTLPYPEDERAGQQARRQVAQRIGQGVRLSR